MKHIFWTADERSNKRKILTVSTQPKQLRKESLNKIQAWTGFEPMTSAIPVQCSINWAIKLSFCSCLSCGWGSFLYLINYILGLADQRSNSSRPWKSGSVLLSVVKRKHNVTLNLVAIPLAKPLQTARFLLLMIQWWIPNCPPYLEQESFKTQSTNLTHYD